jgi:hypothetical protein
MSNQLKRGDYVVIINEHGKLFRKVSWVSTNTFEWSGGWAKISELEPNIKNRKAKFILNQLEKI